MKFNFLPKEEKDYYRNIYGLTSSPELKYRTLETAKKMLAKYESLTFIQQLTYFNNRNRDYAVVVPSINKVADRFCAIGKLDDVLVIEVEIDGDFSNIDVESVYIIKRKSAVETYEPTSVECKGKTLSGLTIEYVEEKNMKIQEAMTKEEKEFYINEYLTKAGNYDSQSQLAKMLDVYGKNALDGIVSKDEIIKNDINQHYVVLNVETGVVADELIGIGGRYSGKDNLGVSRIGVGVKVGREIYKWLSTSVRIMKRTYVKPELKTPTKPMYCHHFDADKSIFMGGGVFAPTHVTSAVLKPEPETVTVKIDSYSFDAKSGNMDVFLEMPKDGVLHATSAGIHYTPEHPAKKKAKEAVSELEKFIDSLQLNPSNTEKSESKEVEWDWTKALDISGTEVKSSVSSIGLGGEGSIYASIDNNSVVGQDSKKLWEERVKEANKKLTDNVSLDNVSIKKPTNSKVDVITGILHKELRNAMRYLKPTLLDMTEYNGFITQKELDLAMSKALRMLIDNPVNQIRPPYFANVMMPSVNPNNARYIHISTDSFVAITSKDLSERSLVLAGTNKFPRGLRGITYVTTYAKQFIEETGSYGDHIMFGVKF